MFTPTRKIYDVMISDIKKSCPAPPFLERLYFDSLQAGCKSLSASVLLGRSPLKSSLGDYTQVSGDDKPTLQQDLPNSPVATCYLSI